MLGLSSCDKNSSSNKSQSANGTSSNLLVIDLGGDVPTLDPAMVEDDIGNRVIFDLYDGLVSFDQDNNPILSMAKSYTVSPDGKTYTFALRDNLKFSNGYKITSDDFVYSWQRAVSSELGSPYAYLMDGIVNAKTITAGKMDKNKLGVKAVNLSTVQISLVAPDSDFIKKMTMPIFYVVDRNEIEKYKDRWTEPGNLVSSGAYVLKDHIINGYIILNKNANYFDESNVHVNTIKFTANGDDNTNYMQYKAGGVDTTFTLPIDQRVSAKATYPQQYKETSKEAINFYDFNMALPEFKNNPKLRQALSMAIDRGTLATKVLGTAVPLYAPVSSTIDEGKYGDLHYDWESWPRDKQIAEAQRLYKEAGYSAAKPLTVQISYNTADSLKKVALAISSMWKDTLGVNTTIANMEWKTFLQARRNGNYEIARDGWVADYNSVFVYTPSYLCGNPQNNSQYCNPKYDALVNQALLASDDASKVKLLHQAFQIVMNDYPTIPMFQNNYYRLVDQKIGGYVITGNHLDHVKSKWYTITQ